VYVSSLSHHLKRRGNAVTILAPWDKKAKYTWESLDVVRFPISEELSDIRELYDAGNEEAANEFAVIIDELKPDIVHLHAFTRAVSLKLVRESKKRDIPVVFTYHTPTVSCLRGTLLRWGNEICDGNLELEPCTQCTLHSKGLNKTASGILSLTPKFIARLVDRSGFSGGMWTALRMRELVSLEHLVFRSLMEEVDHVVAVCQWVKDLLVLNGVNSDKITILRQGVSQTVCEAVGGLEKPLSKDIGSKDTGLKVAFLGRSDPTKGADTLIKALRINSDLNIKLDIYQSVQDKQITSYHKYLKSLAENDNRISFFSFIKSEEVVTLLKGYDLLAVPSRVRETGPLVVLEAFAAGIPVIGSNLGGIAELVEHGTNGILVAPDDETAWSEQLRKLYEDKQLISKLRTGVRFPRTMREVAEEMDALYVEMIMRNSRQCSGEDTGDQAAL